MREVISVLYDIFYALQYLNKALKINPDFRNGYDIRGQAYHLLGDYKKAVKDFSRVIRFDPPRSAYGYEKRGDSYFKQDDFASAVADFKTALGLRPLNSGSIALKLGLVYYLKGDKTSAIKALKKSIRDDPKNVQGHNLLGLCHFEAGNYAKTVKYFSSALRTTQEIDSYAYRGDKLFPPR